jgi:predicted FMN-binding regulatory protein PaiB
MTALTNQEERKVGGEWKVDDAPEGYRKVLERAVIGLRVEIESMEGRWKLSQEKNSGDWNGVVNGVKSMNPTTQNASSEPDNIVNLVEKAGWRWGQDRESK